MYEHDGIKTKDFPLFHPQCEFTDDTVLTVAIANSVLSGQSYLESVRTLAKRYPNAGYGASFAKWVQSRKSRPYNSWGNGSAMRVSPIGFAFSNEDEVLRHARLSAEITHNHPEGIKGAEATALAVFIARTKRDKELVRTRITELFGYDLNRTLDTIRPTYSFDVSCQGTVPESLIAFLESDSYEDAIRNAISLGGDSDALACITGGVAEAFYGEPPASIIEFSKRTLTPDLWEITEKLRARYL
ncbi:MAG TPA: ADP-ribosylglycohydrolase family protein [Steroidobacteraceae bacterium]|nr:ADP-ribosylglycohydrolase family protein [Steroidobacteraceae bacterium]